MRCRVIGCKPTRREWVGVWRTVSRLQSNPVETHRHKSGGTLSNAIETRKTCKSNLATPSLSLWEISHMASYVLYYHIVEDARYCVGTKENANRSRILGKTKQRTKRNNPNRKEYEPGNTQPSPLSCSVTMGVPCPFIGLHINNYLFFIFLMQEKKTTKPKTKGKVSQEKPKKSSDKKQVRKPSLRQQKAIKIITEKMVENGGKINKWEVLAEAWYSPAVQATPDKVFSSASMRKAVKSIWLDPKSLKIKHRQLMNATRIESIQVNMNIPADQFVEMFLKSMPWSQFLNWWDNDFLFTRIFYFLVPDVITQTRVLDMAYKISGEYAPEKHEHTGKDGEALIPKIYLPDNARDKKLDSNSKGNV